MAPAIPGFNTVWVDDFTGPAGPPDTSKWNIIDAGPNAGNQEVQTYTLSISNVSINGLGQLDITPERDGDGHWESGRVEGRHSFACPTNGKMILQADIRTGTDPASQQAGIWPAFWALGASIRHGTPWPECGEWDIMENASGASFTIATLHYGPDGNFANQKIVGGQPGTAAQANIDVQDFNTYSLTVDLTSSNWEDQTLTWSLNGQPWFSASGSNVGDQTLWANVAQKPFYPILNVAVGSDFPDVGSQPNAQTASGLGSGMQVRYVAFYQTDGAKKEL